MTDRREDILMPAPEPYRHRYLSRFEFPWTAQRDYVVYPSVYAIVTQRLDVNIGNYLAEPDVVKYFFVIIVHFRPECAQQAFGALAGMLGLLLEEGPQFIWG